MKRILLLTLSLLLCLTMMTSCGKLFLTSLNTWDYPEGYTAGFGSTIYNPPYPRFYWLETYDELVEAMKSLESHGSTFCEMAFTNYEGELFDIKYCISMDGRGYVKFGDYPFDRYATNISIISYAFFDDVTIDELVYSNISYYDTMAIGYGIDKTTDKFNAVSLENLTWEYVEDEYHVSSGKNLIFSMQRYKNGETLEISDEIMNAIMNNVVSIGFE